MVHNDMKGMAIVISNNYFSLSYVLNKTFIESAVGNSEIIETRTITI